MLGRLRVHNCIGQRLCRGDDAQYAAYNGHGLAENLRNIGKFYFLMDQHLGDERVNRRYGPNLDKRKKPCKITRDKEEGKQYLQKGFIQ